MGRIWTDGAIIDLWGSLWTSVENRPRGKRSAKPHTPQSGSGDTFRLSLFDVGALILSDKGKDLQYDVAEEGSHQVFPSAGVQQGHIQNHDVNSFLFREIAPLILDFLIIASQTVNAFDIEQIVFFHSAHHAPVSGAVEVFS